MEQPSNKNSSTLILIILAAMIVWFLSFKGIKVNMQCPDCNFKSLDLTNGEIKPGNKITSKTDLLLPDGNPCDIFNIEQPKIMPVFPSITPEQEKNKDFVINQLITHIEQQNRYIASNRKFILDVKTNYNDCISGNLRKNPASAVDPTLEKKPASAPVNAPAKTG